MGIEADVVQAARAGDHQAFTRVVEAHRRELKAHCYRLSGSLHEAEDLVQESLLRAWRGIGTFAGRSSLRSWLYRVTTNTCLDALDARRARTLPQWLGPPTQDVSAAAPPRGDLAWLSPCPDEIADATPASPEARLGSRQAVALAFLTVLQSLPPRQRAVLLLRDVVGWEASECAEVLEMTVAAVNSALQRARATLAEGQRPAAGGPGLDEPPSEATRAALARYLRAWEEADASALVEVLRDDARLAMPPYEMWFEGAAAIIASLRGMVLPPEAAGVFRLVPTRASAAPAFAAFALDAGSGEYRASALHVLTFDEGGRISAIDAFLDPSLFPLFGLPAVLAR